MKRRKKWETLPESDRQLVAAKTIAAVLDGAPTPAAHPLVGMYAHKTSTDPETTRFGWNHANQVRIHAVSDGVAWVQYFSYIDGDPTDIKPLPLSEMIAAESGWVFYATWEEWRRKGDEAQQRYWDMWHRERETKSREPRFPEAIEAEIARSGKRAVVIRTPRDLGRVE